MLNWNDDFNAVDPLLLLSRDMHDLFNAAVAERLNAASSLYSEIWHGGNGAYNQYPLYSLHNTWNYMKWLSAHFVEPIDHSGYERIVGASALPEPTTSAYDDYTANPPDFDDPDWLDYANATSYDTNEYVGTIANRGGTNVNYATQMFSEHTVLNAPLGAASFNFRFYSDQMDGYRQDTLVVLESDGLHPQNSVWQRRTDVNRNQWYSLPGIYRGIWDDSYRFSFYFPGAGYYSHGPVLYSSQGQPIQLDTPLKWVGGHYHQSSHAKFQYYKPRQHTRHFPKEIASLSDPGIEGQYARFVAMVGFLFQYSVSPTRYSGTSWFGEPENHGRMGAVMYTPAAERANAGRMFKRIDGVWVQTDEVRMPTIVSEQAYGAYDGDYLTGAFLNELRDWINELTVVGINPTSGPIVGAVDSAARINIADTDIFPESSGSVIKFQHTPGGGANYKRNVIVYRRATAAAKLSKLYTANGSSQTKFLCHYPDDPHPYSVGITMDYNVPGGFTYVKK